MHISFDTFMEKTGPCNTLEAFLRNDHTSPGFYVCIFLTA